MFNLVPVQGSPVLTMTVPLPSFPGTCANAYLVSLSRPIGLVLPTGSGTKRLAPQGKTSSWWTPHGTSAGLPLIPTGSSTRSSRPSAVRLGPGTCRSVR